MKSIKVLAATFAAVIITTAHALAGTTGTMAVTVLDAQKHPVAGAKISLTSPSGSFAATTDKRGFASMLSLYPETYHVVVIAQNKSTYQVDGVTVVADQATALPVTLSEIATIGRVVATNRVAYTVRASDSVLRLTSLHNAGTYVTAGVVVDTAFGRRLLIPTHLIGDQDFTAQESARAMPSTLRYAPIATVDDVSILNAPEGVPALSIAEFPVASGMKGSLIGHPHNVGWTTSYIVIGETRADGNVMLRCSGDIKGCGPGDSGGAVVVAGQLVGVVISQIADAQGTLIMVPVSRIVAVVK